MPVLDVEGHEIPWEIRRSSRARRMRIVVKPGTVEVVLPRRGRVADAHAFVEAKREWVLRKSRSLAERADDPMPERFVSGAKVVFHGRPVPLRVEPAEIGRARLDASPEEGGRFHVRVPRHHDDEARERAARRLVVRWLDERVLADAAEIAERSAERLGARPAAFRLGNQKTLWGSCAKDGVIRLNRKLMAAPKPVFDYVVVHELCHLVERNHGPGFWRLVVSLMPDYQSRRDWLREHGVALG